MKYFANINNADELRKAYRQHVINLHPDRGGNEEEFKAMQTEFEQLKKQYQNGTARTCESRHTETAEERARREAEEQREREEWARWEAEEKARREQEEREKAERIRKAQEENRAAVRAWAEILERVSVDKTGEKARYYRFDDKKQAAAFVATTKRNIQRVINHYFPGLKVKVTISGEVWKEKFVISWEDGPSEKQLRDTCKELEFFVPSYYESDPYADYGDYQTREGSAPWREAYGQALGDIGDFKTARTLSEEGKQQAEEFAARYFANFDPKSEADKFAANLQELSDLLKAAGIAEGVNVTNIFRQLTGNYHGDMYGNFKDITGEVNRRQLRKMFAEHISVTVTPKAKAPEFVPTYGPAYKAIKKALGANVFYVDHRDSRKNEELTIYEAAERLAKGEAVQIGHKWNYDGETLLTGTDRGGYKTQQKRAQKFAAVGILLEGTSYNTYGNINARGIKAETLEALRREARDIEKQREAWEAKQTANEGTQKPQERTTAAKTDNTPTGRQNRERKATANADSERDTAPAEGLTLEDTAEGVAVIGNSRTTYKHRREIKAHGAKWNRDTQRWEATDPDNIARLRAWFALREQNEPTATAQDEPQATQSEPTANEPTATAQNEPTATEQNEQSGKAAPLYEAGEITDTTDEPTADQSADLSPLMEALADVLRIFGDIMQQAKRWEGVTIPAATLERWKQEANEGTKTAAARLCEVCACLACLTPDSRRDFDALGSIFWTLSEQLKQGYNPDNLQGATDYARAQLYDLIDRTQTRNQARAIREVLTPDNEHREAA